MRPEAIAIFSSLVSLIALGFLGFLLLTYDSGFSSSRSINDLPTPTQDVAVVAVLGALGMTHVVYALEKGKA